MLRALSLCLILLSPVLAQAQTSLWKAIGTNIYPTKTTYGVGFNDSDGTHFYLYQHDNATATRTITYNYGNANRSITYSGDFTGSGTNTGDQSAGNGIAGTTTLDWSPETYSSNVTWWSGTGTKTMTFRVTGTDPVLSFGPGTINVSTGQLQEGSNGVIVEDDVFTGDVTATLEADGGTVLTITASAINSSKLADGGVATEDIADDAVTLGLKSNGNYVATIAAGSGIVTTGAATGEGITHSLSVSGVTGANITDDTLDFVDFADSMTLDAALSISGANAYGVAINGGTVTSSVPVLSISQTWNNAAVGFKGIEADFTTTAASATATNYLNIKESGSSIFQVGRGTGGNPYVYVTGGLGAANGPGFYADKTGDTESRAVLGVNGGNQGSLLFGSGSAALDKAMYWSGTRPALSAPIDWADASDNVLGRLSYTAVAGDPAFIAGSGKGWTFYTNDAAVTAMTIASGGNVNIDSNTLVVDAANNRVGVATASPSTPFDITADGAGSGFKVIGGNGYFLFQSGGGNGAGLFSRANTSSNGLVIGTTSGESATSAGQFLRLQTGSTDRVIVTDVGLMSVGGDPSPDASLDVTNDGSGDSFRVDDTGEGDSTPFVIQSDGDVGIGIASPAYKLHVSGDISAGTIYPTGGISMPLGGNGLYSGSHGYFVWRTGAVDVWSSSTAYATFDTTNLRFGLLDTTPDYQLEVSSPASSDSSFALSDADVAHGLTTLGETDAYALLRPISSTAGGLKLEAFSDTDAAALQVYGYMGSTDPTDATPAVKIVGAKKNTTGVQDLGAAETVFAVANNDDGNAVVLLGDGRIRMPLVSASEATLYVGNGTSFFSANAINGIEVSGPIASKAGLMLKTGNDQLVTLSPPGGDTIRLRNGTTGTVPITFDMVTANVAIGAADNTPDASLEVVNDGSGDSFLVADTNDGDATPFVINSSGNAAFGSASPDRKLSVIGGSEYPFKVTGSAGGGLILGAYSSAWGGFWSAGVTPATNNYALIASATGTAFNAPSGTSLSFCITDNVKATLDSVGNFGLGQTTFGTSAAKVLAIGSGTAPSTSPADAVQVYSVDTAAGDARLNVKSETGSTVTIGNGQVTAEGHVFPATQVASAGANTLDDYEEGTFTPSITFATPGNLSVTYTTQLGTYTKIGRVVYYNVFIVTSAFTHTSASGNFQVTGLPFTSDGSQNWFGGAGATGGYTSASHTQITSTVEAGQSRILALGSGSGIAAGFLTTAHFPTGGTVTLRWSGFYIAA